MLKYAIITIACLPLRFEPSEKSEMETQILFGELIEIIETAGSWSKVKTLADQYVGWVDNKNFIYIDEKNIKTYIHAKTVLTSILAYALNSNNEKIILPGGSILPNFDPLNNTFVIGEKIFRLLEPISTYAPNAENIVNLAKQYLNSPYLWGGKTALGIDCSGLTQVVYKMVGIQLPRNAAQQAEVGKLIPFIEEAKPGDLMFFDNNEGKIIHVGIYLGNCKIIHASGKVRIDSIDNHGIYREELKKYTHTLRLIKRILND
ncbi:MAG: C40 family peptidase [Bacteroidales bacterium]